MGDVAQFWESPATDDSEAALRAESGFAAVTIVAWDAGGTGKPERMKVRDVT